MTITMEEGYFHIEAMDTLTGEGYTRGGLTLCDALALTILIICKSKKRAYVPTEALRLELPE